MVRGGGKEKANARRITGNFAAALAEIALAPLECIRFVQILLAKIYLSLYLLKGHYFSSVENQQKIYSFQEIYILLRKYRELVNKTKTID